MCACLKNRKRNASTRIRTVNTKTAHTHTSHRAWSRTEKPNVNVSTTRGPVLPLYMTQACVCVCVSATTSLVGSVRFQYALNRRCGHTTITTTNNRTRRVRAPTHSHTTTTVATVKSAQRRFVCVRACVQRGRWPSSRKRSSRVRNLIVSVIIEDCAHAHGRKVYGKFGT